MTLRQWTLAISLLFPTASAIALGATGGGWFYLYMVLAIGVCLGVFELISYKTRGKTISKDIGEAKPWVFWFVNIGFILMAVFMVWHWILYLK